MKINICPMILQNAGLECYPDIIKESGTIKPDYQKKIFRRMIKDKHNFLYTNLISFEADIPIFLYEDLNKMFNKQMCRLVTPLDVDNLNFESNSDFTSKEELSLSSIFKKVKTSLIEHDFINWERMKYFLPMSTIINTIIVLNYIEVFELLSVAKNSSYIKLNQFGTLLMTELEDKYSTMFNEYNLQIFEANKGDLSD